MGVGFGFLPRTDAFTWRVVVDSRSQEAATELLAHAVFRPVFDGPLVEAHRQALVKQAGGLPLRDRTVSRFLWDLGDPRTLLAPGTQWMGRVEFQDMQDLHRRLVRPERAQLALYGDLSLAQAKQLVLLQFGVWGPARPKETPLPLETPAPGGVPFVAVLEPLPRADIWAGAPRPAGGVKPGVEALLAILLEDLGRRPAGGLDVQVELPPGGELVLRVGAREGRRSELVPGFKAALDRLRVTGFSPLEVDRARVRWRARRATLPLHPGPLLQATLAGGLEPELEQAVNLVTAQELNETLAAWLAQGRLRLLLLGGDASLVKAAEEAGLGRPEMAGPTEP
jgi:hypothetical protein